MHKLTLHSTPFLQGIVDDLSGFYSDSEWYQANAELLRRTADGKYTAQQYVREALRRRPSEH